MSRTRTLIILVGFCFAVSSCMNKEISNKTDVINFDSTKFSKFDSTSFVNLKLDMKSYYSRINDSMDNSERINILLESIYELNPDPKTQYTEFIGLRVDKTIHEKLDKVTPAVLFPEYRSQRYDPLVILGDTTGLSKLNFEELFELSFKNFWIDSTTELSYPIEGVVVHRTYTGEVIFDPFKIE